MAEREASGDFDYLWDDPADVDGLTSDDRIPGNAPDDDLWDEPDDSFWDNQPDRDGYLNGSGRFDAFNIKTWSFTPPPTPWYRTKPALAAIIAASAAMAAIVVSGVLLVVRLPGSSTLDGGTSSVTPTAPTSAEAVEVATSAAPPPPLPPPPQTAPPANTAPQYGPTSGSRPTKRPEFDVTRSAISVAPQPRTSHPGFR